MKRILMISTHGYFEGNPSFGRADTGGQIVFVIELSKALAKLGYKIDILTRQFENRAQIEVLNEDVRIVRMPCGGNDFIPKEYLVHYLPELIDGFKKYCRDNELSYEFIDSHYWDAGYVGLKLAEEFKIPYIFTPHSLGIWKEMNTRKSMADEGKTVNESDFEAEYNFKERNSTEKEIMQKAAKVIATTPEQKSIIDEKYEINPEKMAVIPPGFFPDKYHRIEESELAAARKRLGLPDRFIITVGRIASNKGYDLLINAFKDVKAEIPDVKLVFAIGSNEESDKKKRADFADMAKDLGLAEDVLFYGHVKELEVFYNAAEILVMPSTYEPFGMVAIEGMACGTPAVVTSLGGLKDFLVDGEDALFANPLDKKALAETIIRLLSDTGLKESISRKGYEKAHSTFTWEMIAGSTINLVSDW